MLVVFRGAVVRCFRDEGLYCTVVEVRGVESQWWAPRRRGTPTALSDSTHKGRIPIGSSGVFLVRNSRIVGCCCSQQVGDAKSTAG